MIMLHSVRNATTKLHMENPSDIQALKEGCYYDEEAADRAVKFIETYVIPSTVGKTITLLKWQSEIVRKLFGWKRRDGKLRFRRVVISVSKKNGKTLLMAAILLYGMLGGITNSPSVASASTCRKNASQIHREIAYSIRHNPRLKQLCKVLDSTKEIKCKDKDARYWSLSAESASARGENLSMIVVDETAWHESPKLYQSLENAFIARKEGGLFINISTVCDDMGHFWWDIFNYAKAVEEGSVIDTAVLGFCRSLPAEADLEDPANWRIVNPSLGTSFSEEDFRLDLETAKKQGNIALITFKRERLNMWCSGDDAFIDGIKWDRCLHPMSDAELINFPCFASADLSQTTDPCSVSLIWALGNRQFFIRSHGWVCAEGVKQREASNLPKYQAFATAGEMTITPGNVNDYNLIKQYILQARDTFKLKSITFDQYNAIEMACELSSMNIEVFRQPQTVKYYTAPMKDFQVAVNEMRIKQDGNRWLRWALINAKVEVDSYGNCRPCRKKSTDKVDAAITAIMSFGQAVNATVSVKPSVYENRGITILG